ncbi:MAG: TrbI/VirB10 family protein [Sphingomicrobium sp.]
MSLPTVASGFALLGLMVFSWLAEARSSQDQRSSALPPLSANPSAPAPTDAPATGASKSAQSVPLGPAYFDPNRAPPVTLQANSSAQSADFSAARGTISGPTVGNDGMRARLNAPALVVDFAQADPRRSTISFQQSGAVDERGIATNTNTTTMAAPPGGGGIAVSTTPQDRSLSDVEQFSRRVGNSEVEVARASRMTGLDRLVPQGAVVGATMETALNSDLPGFARAITQRGVYSFDGSAILIPAGSRLIGQYKSGVAQGASRVFILWTRLIRPDGVTIELASPATDELGRGGVTGKINRHFFQRYGGAILTSVLTGAVNAGAAALSGGATILVGSASQASALAGQAAQGNDIPPTITTRQGAQVRIFVARDLDFSAVGPAR